MIIGYLVVYDWKTEHCSEEHKLLPASEVLNTQELALAKLRELVEEGEFSEESLLIVEIRGTVL